MGNRGGKHATQSKEGQAHPSGNDGPEPLPNQFAAAAMVVEAEIHTDPAPPSSHAANLLALATEEVLSPGSSAVQPLRQLRLSSSRNGSRGNFQVETSRGSVAAPSSARASLEEARAALKTVMSKDDMLQEFHRRELVAAAFKSEKADDWLPEYRPISIVPPSKGTLTHLERITRVSPACILADVPMGRKTKIVCTLGPSCWSEEGLGKLLEAGMDVARFNFSHGTHAGHQEVLDRLRKVATAKKSNVAYMLDTKGPEVRTAMLRDGKDIELTAGQNIVVFAAGDEYTTFEGYKDEETGETKIGISYAKLCHRARPGNVILIADGAISIEVVKILSNQELLGRVINSHTLGQRKNCNLPGVHVDLPVLGAKDIDDVQNFAVKNGMDFIAASFVQCADDVRFIRKVLDDAGGFNVKIISKIENEAGLRNIDSIIEASDGIMVARGDLAMEVPAEKVALAQKMIVAKCNVVGKFVITATQMLESMTASPLPTRAEMTDVANAVFDGTDAVMLSGETANGAYADTAVRTMARIAENAELGVDYSAQYDWIKRNNAGKEVLAPIEAALAGIVKVAITLSMDANGDGVQDTSEGCIAVVLSHNGYAARTVSKYRPPCPVFVISDEDWVLRQCSMWYGLYPFKAAGTTDVRKAVGAAVNYARFRGLAYEGKQVLVAAGSNEPWADSAPQIMVEQLGGAGGLLQRPLSLTRSTNAGPVEYKSPFKGNAIHCVQTLHITPDLIVDRLFNFRSVKIIATLGPPSWTDDKLMTLLDCGTSIVRIITGLSRLDFYQNLLDRIHRLIKMRTSMHQPSYTTMPAVMVTLQGPEARTTMLREHKRLPMEPGQSIVLVPTLNGFFEGWRDTDTGNVCTGITDMAVANTVQPGDKILLGDGSLVVEVTEVTAAELTMAIKSPISSAAQSYAQLTPLGTSPPSSSWQVPVDLSHPSIQELSQMHATSHVDPRATVVVVRVINKGMLDELAGVEVLTTKRNERNERRMTHEDAPFLNHTDEQALLFCCKNQVDFVSLPFVREPADVRSVRAFLDKHGGERIRILSHIDTAAGIHHYDGILDLSDGIIISRGNLGMRIPAEKVALAQKWMTTKANLAGKPVVISGQMLHSMIDSPRPTRAEMTDVANALYDGADAICLREETLSGNFVDKVVQVAANILKDAEVGVDSYAQFNFLRNFTPKPMPTLECLCSSAVKAAIDMDAALIALVTNTTAPVRVLAKYRPHQAIVVVTTRDHVARQANINFGCVPLRLNHMGMSQQDIVKQVVLFARQQGLARFDVRDKIGDQLIVVQGPGHRLFTAEEDLAEMEFVTHNIGQESAQLIVPTGYNGADTIAYRSTKVGLDLVCDPVDTRARKTKVVCTLGPKCWTKEGLEMLVDSGMNIARFNFSHGTHADHEAVLDRLRGVLQEKRAHHVALLLDTKGPEIRTAMLRNHEPIELVAGQDIIVVAVGDQYTTWEGYKDAETGETKIGLSYQHLCRDVKAGGMIKIGDGQISLKVTEVLNGTELRAVALNTKKLGERKNVNLPGVHVDLPVLGPNDITDVQQFAVKNEMDFVAASFVQSADDVRFIRKVLDEVGGQRIKIISKIESTSGLLHYDDILFETDGIMVARGDLAMEVPSEKVALAQKMMITKANIAGKFVITATQMLESMTANPLPTRAEMTDVANAVFDGTDAVMLSGETANGAFPDRSVATMAAIVANAEVGTNYVQVYDFIRDFTAKPMSSAEAVLSCAAKNVLDVDAALIIVLSSTGACARLVSKYRPKVPIVLITDNELAARSCAPLFAVQPHLVKSLPKSRDDVYMDVLLEETMLAAIEAGLCAPAKDVAVVHGCSKPDADDGMPMVTIKVAPGEAQLENRASDCGFGTLRHKPSAHLHHAILGNNPLANMMSASVPTVRDRTKTLSLRTTAISLADVLHDEAPGSLPRKTKIVCTLGPSCWSEDGLAKLLEAGMDVARFNFSHGTHASHQEVLDRLRKVHESSGPWVRRIAYLLDTKGPEVRTAMVRGGKDIELVAGQELTLVAVGDQYTTWEGYKDAETGETKIGISYEKLCQSVKVGGRILMSDGSLSIEVLEIIDTTQLRGRCLNSKSLGPRKNVNLPGVHVDIPVLTAKDVEDLQQFCCTNKMDYVAASFVQSADDVRYIRRVLDEAGGCDVKIISKIENEAGLTHYDAILRESDGIMVARGDLAMEIPSEKVALAQKMMITKANIAGKFVITATQMLESMTSNPLPTRAEMTDVANAVFDGTDAVMLSGETANGSFPDTAVSTMSAIVANAENGNAYMSTQAFIRDHTPKPFGITEAFSVSSVAASVDCAAQLIVTFTQSGYTSRFVSKYRPAVPQIVITDNEVIANQACAVFGQYPLLVGSLAGNTAGSLELLVQQAAQYAKDMHLWPGEGAGIVLHGMHALSADNQPVLRVVDLADLKNPRLLGRTSLGRAFSIVS